MVLGATDRLSCVVSLSKFYSSGDPLFLGDSPSPVFTTVLERAMFATEPIGGAFILTVCPLCSKSNLTIK